MSKKNKTMLDQVEEIKDINLMDNLKSNEQLKKALILARNMSRKLRDDIVPQLSKAVISVMKEMLENKTEIADWKTMKFLRGHCFTQSGYDRKKDLNQNFELSVTMAVRLAIMTYDNSTEFQITDKNEILVMDKVATPWIDQTKSNQKGGKKKVKNTSEELVEIVPSAINKIWATKYPTTKRPNAKPKENISVTLKSALKVLEDLQNICESKNPQKIAERITDEDAGVIGSYTLIDFALIRNTFAKYEVNIVDEVVEKKSA
tara:strand:+ start:63 stop:845 length:783 start_codon:yes stop_codon:yes gene_type:complete